MGGTLYKPLSIESQIREVLEQMCTIVNSRKNVFEKKFAHDQELEFKVEARCCKLFGLWMAEQLGLSGDDAKTYANGVIGANL